MRNVARFPLPVKAKMQRPVVLILAALSVIACSSGPMPAPPRATTGQPALIFDTEGAFFDSPFPSDARRHADGAPDFDALPNPEGIGFVSSSVEAVKARDGFDPGGAIYFHFDGPLPVPAKHTADNLEDFTGILLIDVDPDSPEQGQRYPVRIRSTEHHDGIRPANLLQILPEPGISLREATTYAVVVQRDLQQDGRMDLAPSPKIQSLLEKDEKTPSALRQSFSPLREALPALNIAKQDIAAATVFTTGTPTAELFRWTQQALTQAPLQLAKPLERERDYPAYVVLKGALKMPKFQNGTPPHFFSGGYFQLDDDKRLSALEYVEAPFYLTIPKGNVPADGVPLYFYIHGTGGHATQAIDRGYRRSVDDVAAPGSGLASWVAPLGYATSCIAGAYSPDRIGWRALDGYAAYMFFNPAAMRDNLRQMALEQVYFLRFLETLEISPELVPEAVSSDADGLIRFAKTHRIVGGQSLGSYLSGIVASVTQGFDGAILTGAGGSWIEFGFGPKDPIDLTALLDRLAMRRGEKLDPHHPFITVFQNAVGPSDNTNYLPYVLRRTKPGQAVPHVLVIQGQRDLQVPVNLQRALTLSLGIDLVGPETGKSIGEQLYPVLKYGALRHVPGGLAGNRMTADGSPRTAVTVRHPEDGILEGHYVVFQQARAKEQLVKFVRDVSNGEVPFVQ